MWPTVSTMPGGPTIVSGVGSNVVIHCVVMTSFRSVMWSLCRWVMSTVVSALGGTPTAAMRITTPRPQSTRWCSPPAWINVAGPARSGSGRGLPVPRSVIEITVCSSPPPPR